MKRVSIAAALVILCLCGSSSFVQGAGSKFPARPIEMIVPFPPGGTADIATRIVMDQLSKELVVPAVVVNKPGASGTTGYNWVLKGNPDGHLLVTGMAGGLIMPYFFFKSVPYDIHKDFLPLAYVGESPSVLAVQSASPFNTFDDMINSAKKNPGKLSYATSGGLSSISTMNMEVVKNQTGTDITTVVYDGGGPALIAILGGHVDIIAASLPALVSQVEAGKLRVLVTSKKIDELPNVPTLSDKGFPMVINWTAFCATAKIPQEAANRLVAAFDKALGRPGVMKKLKDAGYIPERKTPAEISQLLRQQYDLVAKIVKETKLKK